MEEFLEIRKNPRAFSQLCDHILPCVVGKKHYGKKKSVVCMSEIATETDEAWALLVLENSWEAWRQQAESPTGIVELKDRKQTVWTNTSSLASRSEGWGEKGIKRFNELMRKVIKDRHEDKTTERLYLREKQEESDEVKSRKKVKRVEDIDKEDVMDSFGTLNKRKDVATV